LHSVNFVVKYLSGTGKKITKGREQRMDRQISHLHRENELGNIPFRSDRFFSVGDKWYFTTREGFDSGPYANRERAEKSLKRFLNIISKLPKEDPQPTHH
jgi:hypothetical protein